MEVQGSEIPSSRFYGCAIYVLETRLGWTGLGLHRDTIVGSVVIGMMGTEVKREVEGDGALV